VQDVAKLQCEGQSFRARDPRSLHQEGNAALVYFLQWCPDSTG
jgi:hypothetical protein